MPAQQAAEPVLIIGVLRLALVGFNESFTIHLKF
jgi:hypothetical protein